MLIEKKCIYLHLCETLASLSDSDPINFTFMRRSFLQDQLASSLGPINYGSINESLTEGYYNGKLNIRDLRTFYNNITFTIISQSVCLQLQCRSDTTSAEAPAGETTFSALERCRQEQQLFAL